MHQTLGQIISLGYGLNLCPHQVAPHTLEQCKVVKVSCTWGRTDGGKSTQEPAVCRGISKLLNSNSAQNLAQLRLTEHHQPFHTPVSPLHDPATSRTNAPLLCPCLLELTNGEALGTWSSRNLFAIVCLEILLLSFFWSTLQSRRPKIKRSLMFEVGILVLVLCFSCSTVCAASFTTKNIGQSNPLAGHSNTP